MSNMVSFDLDVFDGILKDLKGMEERLRPAADAALRAAWESTTPGLERAIWPHTRSGRTAASLIRAPLVHWPDPTTAFIRIGFQISEGGLASVFLMRGTKYRMKRGMVRRDGALYDAIWGKGADRREKAMMEAFFSKLGM